MAKTPQQECAMYFFDLLGNLPAHKGFIGDWMDTCESLLNELNCTPDQLQELMRWAVEDNTSDKPQFDSTVYIPSSRDPLATFAKHAATYMARSKATKKSAAKEEAVPPIESSYVQWMMVGPGVNQPLNGWTSWQQKLEHIKRAWYGKGWETAPMPASITDEMYAMWFNDSQQKYSRIIGDDED